MTPIRCLPLATLPLLAALTGCGSDPAPSPAPPAKADAVAHESDLLKLTITTQAQQRLGIRTVRIGDGSAAQIRETSGEIVVPATGGAGVPTGSTSNLAQIGISQVAAEGEVARAHPRFKDREMAADIAGDFNVATPACVIIERAADDLAHKNIGGT